MRDSYFGFPSSMRNAFCCVRSTSIEMPFPAGWAAAGGSTGPSAKAGPAGSASKTSNAYRKSARIAAYDSENHAGGQLHGISDFKFWISKKTRAQPGKNDPLENPRPFPFASARVSDSLICGENCEEVPVIRRSEKADKEYLPSSAPQKWMGIFFEINALESKHDSHFKAV